MTTTQTTAPTPGPGGEAAPVPGAGAPGDAVLAGSGRGRRAPVRAAVRARLGEPEAGMATAEYAIATVAAAGFAGLLLLILRSDEVRGMLLDIVRGALAV